MSHRAPLVFFNAALPKIFIYTRYRRFETILHQKNLFNYNIILARKKVLREYCEWLFPILFRIEELSNPDGTKKTNRYIGYIGKTIETIYFMTNKNQLNIVHAGIEFLV